MKPNTSNNHVDIKLEDGKMIALHDSVSKQTYNYLVNKGYAKALDDVGKISKDIIDKWWYSLDENHRPFANETNRLIRELKQEIAKESKS